MIWRCVTAGLTPPADAAAGELAPLAGVAAAAALEYTGVIAAGTFAAVTGSLIALPVIIGAGAVVAALGVGTSLLSRKAAPPKEKNKFVAQPQRPCGLIMPQQLLLRILVMR